MILTTLDKLHDACKDVSAYEIAENLQIVARLLGFKDQGWKDFSEVLKHANSHVSATGEFPK